VRLILASGSPRRAELLRAAGYLFEVLPVEVDECTQPGEQPERYVQRLATAKATAARPHVADGADDFLILGADTSVVIDGTILGKPANDADARSMLRRLSGRVHEVVTGVTICCGPHETSRVERTLVWFTRLSEAQIDWYVSSGEGRDKAGAYAIQGLASRLIPRIDGSYSNVVGLPVQAVAELFDGFGFRELVSRS
jgi:septum formation protein